MKSKKNSKKLIDFKASFQEGTKMGKKPLTDKMLQRFRELQKRAIQKARKKGIFTDEDVFKTLNI
jgi:hypothetical protein